MTEQRPPRVFISYGHDTVEHQERVLGLADRLRADGIDAEIDQYNPVPSEGWPAWCERQIEAADFVLMVCTETYHRRINGDEERGKGLGVVWEAWIIRQLLYGAGAVRDKFVPVLFSDASPEQIPTPVKDWPRYVVDTEDGYEELHRRLTGQPHHMRPPLGASRPLSAKQPPLLTIFVEAPSRARFQAEVPHDVTIAKLASDFFESQGWPAQDEHSTAVVELVDSRNPDHTKRLGSALTFAEAGIHSGDTLRIFPELRAGCFLGNVPVTLSNGREKAFHDVVVGDELLSLCLDTGHLRTTNVTHVYKGIADHFFSVNRICHVTDAHPFWCDNQWKKVCQLAIGDVLTTVRGEHIQIKSLEFHNQPAIVYNLHLASGRHTFFAGGFLVHNMDYKAMLTSVSKGHSQPDEEMEGSIDAISLKLAQIETIGNRVNELEFKLSKVAEAFELLGTYLRRVHFSPKGKQDHNSEAEEPIIAEITLRGSLENFGEIESKNLTNTIAKKTGIETDAIRVLNIEKGSILVTLEMPEKSALELMKWFINRNPVIYQLKIEKIELRPILPIKHDDVMQLPGSHIRILFLAANPYGTSKLRLDQEVREIDDALLQKAEFRERFEIVQQWAVRIADLQTHLLRFRPTIVHFCGHGSESSEIVLEDADGKSKPVTKHALSNLFALLNDNIRCVVLNACYSESQAQGISEHIECVVGMSKEIGDVAAISFAKSFYQALGYGRSVESAFELGVAQLDLEKVNEQDVPKLVTKDKNASKMKFV